MTTPWTAWPAGTDPGDLSRRLAVAREEFLATGQVCPSLRSVVTQSWQRCLTLGINPQDVRPRLDLTDADLETYRSEHPLAGVMPVVRRLLVEDAAEAGLIVAVTDAAGRLLWVEGSSGMRSRAESMHFVEGARWSEGLAGTNAPGTALALDHAVQIYSYEHLYDPVTPWSCAAAPIHDPDTGALLGALDLTGGDDVATPQTLTLVRAAAAAVEAELRLRRLAEHREHQDRLDRLDRGPARRPAGDRSPTRRPLGRPSPERSPGLPLLKVLGRDRGQLLTSAGTARPVRLSRPRAAAVAGTRRRGAARPDRVAGRSSAPGWTACTMNAAPAEPRTQPGWVHPGGRQISPSRALTGAEKASAVRPIAATLARALNGNVLAFAGRL